MKMMIIGPGGVLENAITLLGFENLCIKLSDDPDLVSDVINNIGQRIYRYYEKCVDHESVGILMINDDWGFKTQTIISPFHLRELIIPWHKKYVDLGHKHGKPSILHSCGNIDQVFDDIIYNIKFDAKHSFEDVIEPVEDFYDKNKNKIAVMGGIDVDFLCNAEPEEIYNRSVALLEKTGNGGYALGSGNSIPDYVPNEKYYAMIAAAHFNS